VRCRHTGLKVNTVGSPPTLALRSKPCVATQTGPKGFKRNPLESCVFFMLVDRGFAGLEWTCFSSLGDSREVPPLRRFPRCGIPTRAKDSRFSTSCSASLLNATYWHLYRAVSLGLFVWFCFALPPDKGDVGRGYFSEISGLYESEAGFTPSPLRGEGWDEEWFKTVLNAANLTPALSLERRGSKPTDNSRPGS